MVLTRRPSRPARCVLAPLAALLLLAFAACGDSDSDEPADTPDTDGTSAPAPTPLPPDPDFVFREALLTPVDLPTEWDPYTGTDNDTLQRYGPEVCGRIGAERWSQVVFFIIGRHTDLPAPPTVVQRVYEYAPGAATQAMDGVRGCIATGAAQAVALPALGDDSIAAQTMADGPDDKLIYTASAAVRRGDFITLILYLQVDNPVEASQLEPFAVDADRKLEKAIFEAPPRP